MTAATLDRAYRHCGEVTAAQAKNFYYAFRFLRAPERRAMHAIYAFCRAADDIADGEGTKEEKAERFDAFDAALERCLAGEPEGDLFVALGDVVRTRGIRREELFRVVEGTRMDLDRDRYETYEDLLEYMDRVAGVVGRMTMRVFGVDPERFPEYGLHGGAAIQMTNILRDVGEDAALGRIYIPREDLRRFGCAEEEILAGRCGEAFRRVMAFEVERAREHYAKARRSLPDAERRRVLPLEVILRIYRRVLDAIERMGYDVFARRARVSGPRKAWIGLATVARARLGLPL